MLKEPRVLVRATKTKVFGGKRYKLYLIRASEGGANANARSLKKDRIAKSVRVIRFNRITWGTYYR